MQNKGYAMGIVLILVAVLVLTAGTFITNVNYAVKNEANMEKSMRAHYAAVTGIERAEAFLSCSSINLPVGKVVEIKQVEGNTADGGFVKRVTVQCLKKKGRNITVLITSQGCYGGVFKTEKATVAFQK
ncbi:hypothetical protein SAMN02746089_01903 [Caldanaerobius fijiensis DSM 17918]|uniref:PilX N-terminal n=2 Tax=Caldanaerobius TaxID=862261 RepID=A0A1M5BLE1_9THEO|nr:hypothetical protein SAMN02746089_01903 [Caldanaerobius fijiensis DSM 17918]